MEGKGGKQLERRRKGGKNIWRIGSMGKNIARHAGYALTNLGTAGVPRVI